MADLRKRKGTATKALEFAILTAARSGEVRGMEWSEIDFDAKVWKVPEGRIKAGKQPQPMEQYVVLCRQIRGQARLTHKTYIWFCVAAWGQSLCGHDAIF